MPYKLIITAGPSLDEETHQIVHVNSETCIPLSSDNFAGQVTVRVAHFKGLAPHGTEPIPNSAYFDKEHDATFSIDATGMSGSLHSPYTRFSSVKRHADRSLQDAWFNRR